MLSLLGRFTVAASVLEPLFGQFFAQDKTAIGNQDAHKLVALLSWKCKFSLQPTAKLNQMKQPQVNANFYEKKTLACTAIKRHHAQVDQPPNNCHQSAFTQSQKSIQQLIYVRICVCA